MGDRVGLLLPNVPAFVAAYYGTLRLGAIAVPLNPLLKPPELRLRLEHAGARVLLTDTAPQSETLAWNPDPVWLDPTAAATADPVAEIVRSRRRRHRRDPLHVGHDGAGEGRRAHA